MTHFMRCRNAPGTLNSLELKIVDSAPASARHVLVANVGDGRLARALREKMGPDVQISVLMSDASMGEYLEDFPNRGVLPLDFNVISGWVNLRGPFDFVVFYQLHEFWRGELHRLHQIIQLARTDALIWISFLNQQSLWAVDRTLPPLRLGCSHLGAPHRRHATLDYASVVDYIAHIGGRICELWGMLEDRALRFLQEQRSQTVDWEYRGGTVQIAGVPDAFLWGAPVAAIAFHRDAQATFPGPRGPKIAAAPASMALYQALVEPYPDHQNRQSALFAAHLEITRWQSNGPEPLAGLAKFFIDRITPAQTTPRVLVVGSGWGRELLILHAYRPEWRLLGIEYSHERLKLGESLRAAAGMEAVAVNWDSALPFQDGEFDYAISFGYFSALHEPAAASLAAELLRVTAGEIRHLEDGRGPENSLHLKQYSLNGVYQRLGRSPAQQPVLYDGKPTGMYLLDVVARG